MIPELVSDDDLDQLNGPVHLELVRDVVDSVVVTSIKSGKEVEINALFIRRNPKFRVFERSIVDEIENTLGEDTELEEKWKRIGELCGGKISTKKLVISINQEMWSIKYFKEYLHGNFIY